MGTSKKKRCEEVLSTWFSSQATTWAMVNLARSWSLHQIGTRREELTLTLQTLQTLQTLHLIQSSFKQRHGCCSAWCLSWQPLAIFCCHHLTAGSLHTNLTIKITEHPRHPRHKSLHLLEGIHQTCTNLWRLWPGSPFDKMPKACLRSNFAKVPWILNDQLWKMFLQEMPCFLQF